MITRKRNVARAGVFVLALAIGAGYWMAGCAPVVVSSSTCSQLDDEGNEYETNLSATSSMGRELTYTRRVITSPEQDGSFRVETDVMADGELIMTVVTTADGMEARKFRLSMGPWHRV